MLLPTPPRTPPQPTSLLTPPTICTCQEREAKKLAMSADYTDGAKGRLRTSVAEVVANGRIAKAGAPASDSNRTTSASDRSTQQGSNRSPERRSNGSAPVTAERRGPAGTSSNGGGPAAVGSAERLAGVALETLAEMACETRDAGASRIGDEMLGPANSLIEDMVTSKANAPSSLPTPPPKAAGKAPVAKPLGSVGLAMVAPSGATDLAVPLEDMNSLAHRLEPAPKAAEEQKRRPTAEEAEPMAPSGGEGGGGTAQVQSPGARKKGRGSSRG